MLEKYKIKVWPTSQIGLRVAYLDVMQSVKISHRNQFAVVSR